MLVIGCPVRITARRASIHSDNCADFSLAGYHASNDPLPDPSLPATQSFLSTGDTTDRTADLQSALNECNGGVLELDGDFILSSSTLRINKSCTIRGRYGESVSRIIVTGAKRTAIEIGVKVGAATMLRTANITDAYVPVGASSLTVDDPTGFAVGDTVYINRYVSDEWLNLLVSILRC